MRLQVEMPDAVYGRLVDAADAYEVKVGDLIAETVWHLVGQPTKRGRRTAITPEVETQVRALLALNRTYADIAEAIGMSARTVSKVAERIGVQSIRARRLAA